MQKFFATLFILLLSTIGFSQSKRYIAHGVLNLETDANNAISVMTKMVAQGCNAVELTIMWERIYPKADAKAYWTQIDNQINHITRNLKVKLAIRIHLGRNLAATKGFWDEASAIQDFRGQPLTVYYNNNHFSFATQPPIDKAKAFVREVCERYGYLQQSGQLIFVSVVNTPQQEAGYAYENQQWPQSEYPAVFDHSKFAMIKLRDWAKNKYTTIRTLNSYWGTTYRSFGEVEPYVNIWNVKDCFRGRRGKDWFLVRQDMLKSYNEQIAATIRGVNPAIKVAQEFGSVTDNLSLLRNTYGFKNLTQSADIIKTNSNYTIFEYDMVSNNLNPNQKYYSEVAVFDRPSIEEIRALVPQILKYNCGFLALYIDEEKDFDKFLPVVREAMKFINIEPSNPVPVDSMKIRLSQMIDNQPQVLDEWKRISGNGKNPIKITLEEDIINDNKKIENPLLDIVETTPVVSPPPPPPPPPVLPVSNVPNQLPIEVLKNYTKEIVVNQNFQFRIPENLYYDTDGFIAYIEVVEKPTWVDFNRFEVNFYGKAPFLGKYKVKVRVYDNSGGSIESAVYLDIVPPVVDLELIKGDYFDVPIEPYGFINNNRVLYLDALPEKLNVIARCNLDSAKFVFDLTGPYKFKGSSDRLPYNMFGEGRGVKFPVGTYTLSAKAYKRDSVITSKTVQFSVKASLNNPASNIINDWVAYPNPFENICNVKIPDNETIEKLSFVYYTVSGKRQEIRREDITLVDKTAYLNLGHSNIPSGNCILEIIKDGQVLKTVRITKIQ